VADLSMTEARKQFGALVRRAATARERVTITDHGQPAVVMVNAQELADLEEQLALARYRADRAAGTLQVVSQRQARFRLGLPEQSEPPA
jgi:prevent-host-death family protein